MKSILSAVFIAAFAASAQAQTPQENPAGLLIVDATQTDLAEFKWKNRPVVVFADSANDPAFIEQMELIAVDAARLAERDVVVITDTDPDARSDIRLRMRPRGFMLTLVGKDGQLKLRKPFPWDVREITASIDKMPMRQREIRERKETAQGS
ncbi:DUF4174 domain-containing protein [Sulfitobacter albidus]|uniref:DUF4174 domain-containing protein n=1 Tax=Sulfitobacter albidus TaxID=2829501 RepID=A0A975JEL2_9RHOB|nr:DUF4174 domain-containing protein [Sulfitobacter albidus]QUJ77064.1 DUF4174 domain-containing protein [Sulfitobacter albidus]